MSLSVMHPFVEATTRLVVLAKLRGARVRVTGHSLGFGECPTILKIVG